MKFPVSLRAFALVIAATFATQLAATEARKPPRLRSPACMSSRRRQASKFFEHLAKKLIDGVRKPDGVWSLEDLARYEVKERKPLVGSYRAGCLGDRDFVDVPIDRLVHPFYAAGQRTSIRMDRATPSSALPGITAAKPGQQTTHFSVLDDQEECARGALFCSDSDQSPVTSHQALALALRTEIRRAPTLHEMPDRRSASAAGLTAALIHIQLLAEVTGLAVSVHVIAQRRTA